MDSFGDEQFKCGSFKLAVSFPEVCMSDKILRTMSIWTTRVQWIVIDEAHCVPQWGAEFRKDFNKLVKLRTIFIDARVVCLTATLTKTIICELSSSLALKVCFWEPHHNMYCSVTLVFYQPGRLQ